MKSDATDPIDRVLTMSAAPKHEKSQMSRRLLRMAAWSILVFTVLIAHLFMPDQISALAAETIRSLHGPGFGIVAVLALVIGGFHGSIHARYTKAASAAIALAIISEIAQIPGAREAQVSDLLVDALGIAAFLGCIALFDHRVKEHLGRRRKVFLMLIVIPAVAMTLLPTFWLTFALAMRGAAIPQILSFDKVWEDTYSSAETGRLALIDAPSGWPVESGKIALLTSAGQFGLMLHVYPYPDWSQYAGVSFVAATTDGISRRIAIGLWDLAPKEAASASRYYTTKMIHPQPARYCLSFRDVTAESGEREFDLTHVSELLLGATRHVQGEELLVDDIRLESRSQDCPSRSDLRK